MIRISALGSADSISKNFDINLDGIGEISNFSSKLMN